MTIKQPEIINHTLMNVGAMNDIKGVILHNDYGSSNATAKWYLEWLKGRDKALGIAHYYVDKNAIVRVVDTNNIGYHAGNYSANTGGYIGYEACGSRWDNGLSTPEFLLNEDMMLRQAAEDLLYYNKPVNRDTVRLHQEFTSTSCPHRSWDLHGQSINSVKDYFISKIKYYQSLGKTVQEIINAENSGATASTEVVERGWHKDDYGWAYLKSDGKWATSEWRKIDTSWFYFTSDGYAKQNAWELIDGKWYFFNDDCSMVIGWVSYKDKWYLLGEDGHMFSKEYVQKDGQLYYLKEDGTLLVDSTLKVNEWGQVEKV